MQIIRHIIICVVVQLDIDAKYKMVMEEIQFLPVTIDGW